MGICSDPRATSHRTVRSPVFPVYKAVIRVFLSDSQLLQSEANQAQPVLELADREDKPRAFTVLAQHLARSDFEAGF